jgi:hypothetical protein
MQEPMSIRQYGEILERKCHMMEDETGTCVYCRMGHVAPAIIKDLWFAKGPLS